MSLTLEWMIGVDDNWMQLDSLDVSDTYFDRIYGVYIVWYGPNEKGAEGRVVCVGHGILRSKLANLQTDPVIARYSCRHLLVTWAAVDVHHCEHVEAYLIGMLNPLHAERHPNVMQTIVNLPAW
jgi:hypothetical protein